MRLPATRIPGTTLYPEALWVPIAHIIRAHRVWPSEDSNRKTEYFTAWPPLSPVLSTKDRMAPHTGHVSNFCGLKRGPLEPAQLLSDQWRTRKTGMPIQTGCPAGILLEPLGNEHLSRADSPRSGVGAANTAVSQWWRTFRFIEPTKG